MDTQTPRIAVLYATAQGSTREIADFIGADLAGRGACVDVTDFAHAPDPSTVDAVVLGSAVHNRALLPAVADYVHSYRNELAALDVWLFSVGLGPALRGPIGRRIGSRVPARIAAVRDEIVPRDYRAFAGHYERAGVDLPARILFRLLGGTRYGDLRDWTAIRDWTDGIAKALQLRQASTTTIHP
ncbi:flavodoxin domain-containing protein [Nocardia sp. alder85J]|uniref:flavodoxin domain-containing protein n=1 Tax=Nocardia sp. alder85J TaxID=2862949 RepID=UPI001CD345BA|nr:flavodoxin domain-containing protein [Nocardia sp. alder85J]MCX4092427.1 flavodoxin domain-containing protein [Nocardia sp. alder85J]